MQPSFCAARFARFVPLLCFLAALFFSAQASRADDGYRLWMRYDALPAPGARAYRQQISSIVVTGDSPTLTAIRSELARGCSGYLGQNVPLASAVNRDGALVVGTPQSSPIIKNLKLDKPLGAVGPQGFIVRSTRIGRRRATVIASQSEVGALYGAFDLLRRMGTLQPINALNVDQKPRYELRMLNHWDDLDGSVGRGYAGKSLWNWDELPKIDPRLIDYARANASLGINGSVLNNVNASAQSLAPDYLRKTAAIADAWRPYGIRVYLSAVFSAPIDLGGLKTADPLDPQVAAWWKAKADEVYALIPDFGGFLVKANSEGQPGPLTYNRSHADGANMMAAALAPHNGIVMWRAFVYAPKPGSDRIAQSYDEFKPLDGKFASNVLLQIKNGPLDFQPREPFHPLFGAMPKTHLMAELQITQEYLGHASQLAFLAPMWHEFLDSDTYAKGAGSTVKKVLDGSITGQKLTGIAGVSNIGNDRNWTGSDLAQANWYAFGRLTWNPDISSRQIANEWSILTFTRNPRAVQTLTQLLLQSREEVVNYMVPLGLTHIMMYGNHYGPQPWRDDNGDAKNTFHHADAQGLGYDRTATGSDAVSQYQGKTRQKFADISQTPDELLLWFHHVPWDAKMRSGRTMWEELALHYQSGVDWTRQAQREWATMKGSVDPQRYDAVAAMFAQQEKDAMWWRDACLLYFQTYSKRPLPAGVEKSQTTLEEFKQRR